MADVLFGDYNPSGKLPITFYKNLRQLPDFEDYSMTGRTYRYMSNPLYPFGFGLNYTTFSIGKATLTKTLISADETIEISVPVNNTGKYDGTEIVQVYVRKVNDPGGPLKTLKGFQRVTVAAGKSGLAVIELGYDSFEFFDRQKGKTAVTTGEYDILYGNSSADADLKVAKISIQ